MTARQIVVHSAHPSLGVSLAYPVGGQKLHDAHQTGAGRLLSVCLVPGTSQARDDRALQLLQQHFTGSSWFDCYWDLPACGGQGRLDPHSPAVSDCLVVVISDIAAMDAKLPKRMARFCSMGKGVVAVCAAADSRPRRPGRSGKLLGVDYLGSCGGQILPKIELVQALRAHPVLAGMSSFRSSSCLGRLRIVAGDVTVLFTGTDGASTMPVAWVRPFHGGRALFTSLGHPADFHHPSFLRLLGNAVSWTAGWPAPGDGGAGA